METIQVQVSSELAQQLRFYARELPQILELGLRHWEQQQNEQDKVNQALINTGFIRHLATKIEEPDAPRQPPPKLPGPPTSEILIAHRHGGL